MTEPKQTEILTKRLTHRLTNIKNDVEITLLAVEEINNLKVTCCKCHGIGTYKDNHQCEVCKGKGKLTLEFYEHFQVNMRMLYE